MSNDQIECCLCGRPAKLVGVFAPDTAFAKRIGQPPGKTVVYALCGSCAELPDWCARVERAMLRDMQVQ
jgi:hypothetical protein